MARSRATKVVTLAVLNVHDHASAVDVADLEARELGAAHTSGVENHQDGAIETSRSGIDELRDAVTNVARVLLIHFSQHSESCNVWDSSEIDF